MLRARRASRYRPTSSRRSSLLSDTVYVLGAGANQSVADAAGRRPPLATNFFALAVAAGDERSGPIRPRTEHVYRYIEHYWKRDRDQLQREPFDLEELFTLLQLQMSEALRSGNQERYRTIAVVYGDATEWLASYLAGFDESLVYKSPFTEFGALLWHDPSTVITFNYDCMLEYALANASGVNRGAIPRHNDRSSDAALTYSHYNWNPARAYGIRFEEVEPSRAGGGEAIPGETFYEHPGNDLYTTPILKLHGSLNWLRYVPVRAFPAYMDDDSPAPRGSILVRRPSSDPTGNMHNGWLTEREIITPVLYKQELLQNEKFELLWQRA